MDPSAVARHYDVLDPYYRTLWGEHVHHGLWERGDESPGEAVEALVHRVARALRLAPGDRVIDVGCGYGGTARLLARLHGARVDGVTLSPAQHRVAAELSAQVPPPGSVRIHLGDWMEVSFPDAAFDAAIAVESLTHMPSLRGALERVARALRPGGRFVACVWLAGDRVGGAVERWLLEPIRREGRLAGLPTADALRGALAGAGLREAAPWQDLSRRVRRTWSITLARGLRRALVDAEARRFLLDRSRPERVFALTMARIWLAYRVGALRYGLFTAIREEEA